MGVRSICVTYHTALQLGEENDDTDDTNLKSDFRSDDFLLVMQSPDQASMMVENPRILCCDATHGLTAYDYKLLSMLVVDRHGHGLVCAWAIGSRENHRFWQLFAESLFPRVKCILVQVLMTDDTNSAYNGLTRVWKSIEHKLLCHWHVKKNVRQQCMACTKPKKVSVSYCSFVPPCECHVYARLSHIHDSVYYSCPKLKVSRGKKVKVGTTTRTKAKRKQSSDVEANSFGLSFWEFFYILLKETNKDVFYTYLRSFRDNLKRYKMTSLLEYFEKFYLAPHRIKQWASWYRVQMFDCDWLLDTNMHVEAWHNVLKTHIMERKRNARIVTLMAILRQAEIMFFWKWARVKLGIRQHSDKRWLAMRGEKSGAGAGRTPTRRSCAVSPPPEGEPVWEPSTEHESRSTNYKERTMAYLEDCMSLLSTKNVGAERLKVVMKHQHAMCNLLRNSPDASATQHNTTSIRSHVETTVSTTDKSSGIDTIPTFVSIRKKQTTKKTMSPVAPKYARKKKNTYVNGTSIKFLKNPENRTNLATSFGLSAVGHNTLKTPQTFPDTDELKLMLRVKKAGRKLSLGGIVFYPVLGGMLIPDDEHGMESLNMRVARVYRESTAYCKGVTSQYYLHKLRVISVGTRNKRDTTHVIGSAHYRNHYTNTIQLEKLATRVDTILAGCIATRAKAQIEVTLLTYV